MENLKVKSKEEVDKAEPKKQEQQEQKEEPKKELSLVDQANEAAQNLKEQIGSLRVENDRLEKLRAATILGGKGDAGQQPAPEKKETDEDFAKKALAGDLND